MYVTGKVPLDSVLRSGLVRGFTLTPHVQKRCFRFQPISAGFSPIDSDDAQHVNPVLCGAGVEMALNFIQIRLFSPFASFALQNFFLLPLYSNYENSNQWGTAAAECELNNRSCCLPPSLCLYTPLLCHTTRHLFHGTRVASLVSSVVRSH